MLKQDDVFKLIKSLSKGEKKFFKFFSAHTAGDKNYLKLFHAMEKQKKYDEEKIKEKLKKERFVKHLSAEKNRLQKQILRALRVFHDESDAENTLYSRLMEINILNTRQLYSMSRDMVTKWKPHAEKFQKHEQHFALIRAEAELDDRTENLGLTHQHIEEHSGEMSRIIEFMEGYRKYKKLYEMFWLYARQRGKDQAPLNKLASTKELKSLDPKNGFYAEKYFYSMNGSYSMFNGNWKASLGSLEKQVAHAEKFPWLVTDNPKFYKAPLINLFSRYTYFGEEKKAFEVLEKLRAIPPNTVPFRQKQAALDITALVVHAELGYYTHNRQFKKAYERYPALLKELAPYEDHLKPEARLVIPATIASILFHNNKYRECLKFIHKTINDRSLSDFRADIQCAWRLMRIFCYYELEDIAGVQLSLKDFKRTISEKKYEYESYVLIADFFSKIDRIQKRTRRDHFSILVSSLEEIMKGSKKEKDLLLTFNHLEWLKGKSN